MAIERIMVEIKKKLWNIIDTAKATEHTFMIIAALIIGALAGYATVLIRLLIKTVSSISFTGSGTILENISAAPWYVRLAAPTIGGLIVGPIIYFLAREAKRSGVPEVMQSVILQSGEIRPRVAVIKALTASISIGTGGSVGREGPIVHIGSSIGSTIAQLLHVSRQRMKTFVGCGAAAAIAAAFNAPVAGALFAVEIILQDFALSQFSPIVIASVMGTVISHNFHGNFAEFRLPSYELVNSTELLFYLGLAVLVTIVGFIFIKTLYFFEDLYDKKISIPDYLKPATGGLMVGILALSFPEIMGVGYETINNALMGSILWKSAALLIFVKILATSLTLGSGGSGGIFAPSLFLGAMVGAAYGFIIHSLFPDLTSTPGAYALVAMGGVVSATTHAPITAILMIFELTNNYQIILPLMATCIFSTILSTHYHPESIYTLKLLRRNIQLKNGTELNIMKALYVRDIFTKTFETIEIDAPFNEIVNSILSGKDPYFPVVTKKGDLFGIISINDIKEYLYDRDNLSSLLIAGDIANRDLETVTVDDNCQEVIEKTTRKNLEGLPVLASKKSKKLTGMIWKHDILDAYNREVERRDVASSFASRITMQNIDNTIHFMEGYSMTEIPVPKSFVKKSLKELNLRAKYGVDIVLIRHNDSKGSRIKAIPDANYTFSYNDSIVIAGEVGKINIIKNL